MAAAADVSDADKAMYRGQVDAAVTAVAAAQSSLNHAAQTMALTDAVTALQGVDLTSLSTQEAIDAAQAAIDALQQALDNATELSATEKTAAMTELATANRTVMTAQGTFDTAAQKMALDEVVATLAGLDLDNLMTQEQIDAAVAAITGVNQALEAATSLTDTDTLDATVDVTVAQRKVDRAEMALAENVESQRMALMTAGTALADLDLNDLDTQEKIDAADNAFMALKAALDMASHLSDSEKAMYQTQLDAATETVSMARTGMDLDDLRMAQMEGLTGAGEALMSALEALSGDAAPTQEQIDAADAALAALNMAIEGAEDLSDEEKATAMRAVAVAEGRIAGAKQARMVADTAAEKERMDAEMAANAAMAVTATKLYAGIDPYLQDRDNVNTRRVQHGTAAERLPLIRINGQAGSGEINGQFEKDDATMIAALHGWAGTRYVMTDDDGDKWELTQYAFIGEPTQGRKFGGADGVAPTATSDFLYQLDDGVHTVDTTNAAQQMLVASASFDQGAGVKTFKLPENNMYVAIPGTYHGVSGTWQCTPADASTCASRISLAGIELGNVADTGGAFNRRHDRMELQAHRPEHPRDGYTRCRP